MTDQERIDRAVAEAMASIARAREVAEGCRGRAGLAQLAAAVEAELAEVRLRARLDRQSGGGMPASTGVERRAW